MIISDENEQLESIERFITTYNKIDKHLRALLGVDRSASFRSVVSQYSNRFSNRSKDVPLLRLAGELRNMLVHERTTSFQYPATPATWLVDQLDNLYQRLVSLPCIIPAFQCEVICVQADNSIAQMLQMIREHDFSQFPVYSEKVFRGLLTENGITRWLSRHCQHETILDLDEVLTSEALLAEEKREDCIFLARETLIDDAMSYFACNPMLEAAIITHNGKQTETPLGIVTRWNVLNELGI